MQNFNLILTTVGPYSKALVLVGIAVLLLLLLVVALSRHKKASGRVFDLIGATGTVHSDLCPGGFVIVRGELMPAISATGELHGTGKKVLVVGVKLGRLAVGAAAE